MQQRQACCHYDALDVRHAWQLVVDKPSDLLIMHQHLVQIHRTRCT